MPNRTLRALALAGAALASLAARPAAAQRLVQYPIPTASSGPWGITRGSYGDLWFTEFNGNKIGQILAFTCFVCGPIGSITETTIPTASAHAKGIALGGDGDVWFAESGTSKIGKHRFQENLGIIEYATLTSSAFPQAITAGTDGALYFTETNASKVARISFDGTITEYPTQNPSTGPLDIAHARDRTLWYTLTSNGDVVQWNPAAPSMTEYGTGAAAAVAIGDDGAVWTSLPSYNAVNVGGITFGTTIYLPTSAAGPGPITAGTDNDAWFLETSVEKLGHATADGHVTEYTLPAGSQPKGVAVGPDGNVWMTFYGLNTIARFIPTQHGDVNDDGKVDVADVFYLINFLFAGGPAPK
jgi:virginiamycin B lyase